MKEYVDIFAPIIKDIIITSLSTHTFPTDSKEALVRPLLKKLNLELINRNDQPVSNLYFVNKLIERAACDQIWNAAAGTGHVGQYQSAYRKLHSTETTLIKVREDIISAIDNKEIIFLLLLDLNAAFDTISTEIVLQRLKFRFGIIGGVLEWLQSYLTGRTQRVVKFGKQGPPPSRHVLSHKPKKEWIIYSDVHSYLEQSAIRFA